MIRARWFHGLGKVGLAAGLLVAFAHTSSAVDRRWNKSTGSGLIFNDAGNWTPSGIPTVADNLVFSLGGNVQIFLGAPSNSFNLDVEEGIVQFTGVGGSVLNTKGGMTLNAANLTLSNAAWDVAYGAVIAPNTFGTYRLENEADFECASLYIGNSQNTFGAVIVTDNSELRAVATSHTEGIFIGSSGNGSLTVSDGGLVRTTDTVGIADISLGFHSTGEGTLSITGENSRLTGEDLFVGESGVGHLRVLERGMMDGSIGSTPDAFVGAFGNARGDAVVRGGGSRWLQRDITLGHEGEGTLSIEAGGLVTANGLFVLGSQTADSQGILTVSGADPSGPSHLEVGGAMTVGQSGQGTVNITAGGKVAVGQTFSIGNSATAVAPNEVAVSGAASELAVADRTVIGTVSNGTLEVSDGGTLRSTGWIEIGVHDASEGVLNVDGAGSQVIGQSDMFVGNEGYGTLNITHGGTVTVARMTIADSDTNANGQGLGTVRVSGADGAWASTLNVTGSNQFFVGGSRNENGGVGELIIEAGGKVNADGMFIGSGNGGPADGTGSVIVTGRGALLDAGAYTGTWGIHVGDTGSGTLLVEDGGGVVTPGLSIGGESDEEAEGMATIDGADSYLDVHHGVNLGTGRAGHLTVRNAATLTSGTGAYDSASIIGFYPTAEGSTLTVKDSGSVWAHDGRLLVGWGGGGSAADERSTLRVLNGGAVTTQSLFVSAVFQSNLNKAHGRIIVDGRDDDDQHSTLSADGIVWFGNQAPAWLEVTHGGLFTNAGGSVDLGAEPGGTTTARVTGEGSLLSANTELIIGRAADATLDVLEGATVRHNGDGVMARDTGTTATVTLASFIEDPAVWDIGGSLFVGGNAACAGGDAVLNVNENSVVNVSGELKIWDRGTVNLSGGTIYAASLVSASGSPDFSFTGGKLGFTGDAVLHEAAMTLLLGPAHALNAGQEVEIVGTATLESPCRLNGGTLSVGSLQNAHNLDFDAGAFGLTVDDLTVGVGGLFGSNLVVEADQTLHITNHVTVDGEAQLIVVGDYSALATELSGDLIVSEPTGSGKSFVGALDMNPGATVTLLGTVTFTDPVAGPAHFYGPGTAVFEGSYDPGTDMAHVQFDGNISLGSENTLYIELGRLPSGYENERLEVAGSAVINGSLCLGVRDDPADDLEFGQTFDILIHADRSGTFSTIDGVRQADKSLAVTYEPNAVRVTVALPADANLDRTVDVIDLGRLGLNFGQSDGTWSDGDFNGDGLIDVIDLGTLGLSFGQTVPTGDIAVAVPEPGGVLLLLLAGLAAVRRRASQPT
jgi:T5SS/PEP-CTERM-associated repeat protein